MTQTIYAIWPTSGDLLPVTPRIESFIDYTKKNWWSYEVLQRSDFEDCEHIVKAAGPNYEPASSDECPDISEADTSIWAFSERAWDWLPDLKKSGCRIACNVQNEKGNKRFKLVYPAPIVDLLDHDLSEYNLNEATGTISHIRKYCLYEWDGDLPMMFHLLRRHPTTYKGVNTSPTLTSFVSQHFADEYVRRGLTGIDLIPMERTARPVQVSEREGVVVYTP